MSRNAQDHSEPLTERESGKQHQEHEPQQPENGQPKDKDGLEFVITEAHDADSEMVGGYKTRPIDDDLGLQTTADLVQAEAVQVNFEKPGAFRENEDLSPIGSSEPPIPEAAESSRNQNEADFSDVEVSRSTLTPPDEAGRIERLSSERVEELSRRMRGVGENKAYLSEAEKLRLLNDLDSIDEPSKGFDSAPIVPPKKALATASLATASSQPQGQGSVHSTPDGADHPKMAPRSRGIAQYYGRLIRISGEQELRDEDELTLNGRDYVMKRWKASTKLVISILAPVAVLTIVALVLLLSSGAGTGEGRIVGLVLDDLGQPFITGAEIRLPGLGKKYQTNAQGFFKTDALPSGSQKIEYVVAGVVVATDYATVTNNGLTTLTIKPDEEFVAVEEQSAAPASAAADPKAMTPPAVSKPAPTEKTATGGSSQSASTAGKKQSTGKTAKLKLEANTENAVLAIDGEVLGAGNLTYADIKPGKRTYKVTKDGYQSASGTIELEAGKTKSLNVALEALPSAARALGAEDFYASGMRKAETGNVTEAIADLTEAIRLKPSYAEAYVKRAELRESTGSVSEAHDDYLRVAEILRVGKQYNDAGAAFGEAIRLDGRSLAAYLGRGSLYLAKGEDIAAVADYDMVVRLDKRNVQGYVGLGEARYNLGNYKKAIKHFKDARSLDPENPLIHQYLMLSYMGNGEMDEVKKAYDKYLTCASAEQARQLRADPKFTAVIQVVDQK